MPYDTMLKCFMHNKLISKNAQDNKKMYLVSIPQQLLHDLFIIAA